MRKIRFFVALFLFAIFGICFNDNMSVKADDGNIGGTERHAQIILDKDKDFCHFLKEGTTLDEFKPGSKVTYGTVAQWFYSSNNYGAGKKYPSQKTAIEYVKNMYYEVACEYPEYAYEFLSRFTDGKFDKFNFKKQCSWDWIISTALVCAYYNNSAFSQRAAFTFDVKALEEDCMGTGGSIAKYYHDLWKKSYSKKNSVSAPNRIEAIHAMYTLKFRFNPPLNLW